MSSNPTRRTTRRRTRSSGQSLVEFAIVFPVFMLVLAGILDFGFLLYSRMTVINAAREGARIAVISPDPATISDDVKNRVLTVAGGLNQADLSTTATCVAIKSKPSACDWSAHGAFVKAQPGDAVSVTVDYIYHGFFPQLFGASIHLGSTVQMVLE